MVLFNLYVYKPMKPIRNCKYLKYNSLALLVCLLVCVGLMGSGD